MSYPNWLLFDYQTSKNVIQSVLFLNKLNYHVNNITLKVEDTQNIVAFISRTFNKNIDPQEFIREIFKIQVYKFTTYLEKFQLLPTPSTYKNKPMDPDAYIVRLVTKSTKGLKEIFWPTSQDKALDIFKYIAFTPSPPLTQSNVKTCIKAMEMNIPNYTSLIQTLYPKPTPPSQTIHHTPKSTPPLPRDVKEKTKTPVEEPDSSADESDNDDEEKIYFRKLKVIIEESIRNALKPLEKKINRSNRYAPYPPMKVESSKPNPK